MGKDVEINGSVITEHEVPDNPPLTFEEDIVRVRVKRDALLSQTDWTQLVDSPLTAEKKTEWATYRQRLRDLPSTLTTKKDVANVVFPSKLQ
tara:strand:- start:256 stop:531 length:276 start_codon:yes stop_codon:yes gene_type:complete